MGLFKKKLCETRAAVAFLMSRRAIPAVILPLLAGALLLGGGQESGAPGYREGNIVRFHVKAHSDAPRDQEIKNGLAEELLRLHGSRWEESSSSAELLAVLEGETDLLEEAAESFLHDSGFTGAADVSLGKKHFPARLYSGRFYPAGEYEALYVAIGDGCGENWWCVLFPPLCFNVFSLPGDNDGSGDGPPEEDGADLNEADSGDKSGKSRYRFWLLELLGLTI